MGETAFKVANQLRIVKHHWKSIILEFFKVKNKNKNRNVLCGDYVPKFGLVFGHIGCWSIHINRLATIRIYWHLLNNLFWWSNSLNRFTFIQNLLVIFCDYRMSQLITNDMKSTNHWEYFLKKKMQIYFNSNGDTKVAHRSAATRN